MNKTTLTGRKTVNARSYFAREVDKDDEDNVPRAVEMGFNVDGTKYDSKRVVPIHALV